jgi:hypothetical protein
MPAGSGVLIFNESGANTPAPFGPPNGHFFHIDTQSGVATDAGRSIGVSAPNPAQGSTTTQCGYPDYAGAVAVRPSDGAAFEISSDGYLNQFDPFYAVTSDPTNRYGCRFLAVAIPQDAGGPAPGGGKPTRVRAPFAVAGNSAYLLVSPGVDAGTQALVDVLKLYSIDLNTGATTQTSLQFNGKDPVDDMNFYGLALLPSGKLLALAKCAHGLGACAAAPAPAFQVLVSIDPASGQVAVIATAISYDTASNTFYYFAQDGTRLTTNSNIGLFANNFAVDAAGTIYSVAPLNAQPSVLNVFTSTGMLIRSVPLNQDLAANSIFVR